MAYAERNSWAALLSSIGGVIAYLILIIPQMNSIPIAQIDWVWPMVASIIGAIVGSIVLGIVWGIIAGIRNPEERHVEDVRDREISRYALRVGQAFLVISMIGALVLSAFQMEWFWIANTIYLGFAASGITESITRVIAYRTGVV